MKTLSKVLSMLLVIVMCLSLFGASAYAVDDYLAPLSDDKDSDSDTLAVLDDSDDSEIPSNSKKSNSIDLYSLDDEPDTLIAKDLYWKVGSDYYETLAKAIKAAGKGGTVTLAQDGYSIDEVTMITNKLTIDLNEHELKITGDYLDVSANVTIKNGTISNSRSNIANITNDATVTLIDVTADEASFDLEDEDCGVAIKSGTFYEEPASKYIASGYVAVEGKDKDGTKVWIVGPEEETYVAYIGSKGYTSADDAFKEAVNGDTITFTESTEAANIETSYSELSKNITIKLGNNCLVFPSTGVKFANADITIKGYKVKGNITLDGSNLVLGSDTDIDGMVWVGTTDSSLTINGGDVTAVQMDAGTLNMASGTIGNMDVDGDVTLNVSGGTVSDFTYNSGSANRAIKGGEWTTSDVDFLKSSIADGYETKQTASPYTVTKKSGTNIDDDDNKGSDGKFLYSWNTKSYTVDSDSTIYVKISDESENGYWCGKSSNASDATKISSSDYTLTNSVSGDYSYRLTLDNNFLDDLSSGTYYFFVVYGDKTTRMGSLQVTKSGAIIVDDGVEVHTRYTDTWTQGDAVLQFVMSPYPSDKKVTVRVDGKKIGNLDWYDYGTGYFYLGKDLLASLDRGTHTLSVETTDGNGSCTFYVKGATLTPVDTTKHVINSSKTLKYVCSDPITKVYVNNKVVDAYDDQTNYKLSSDRKTLTLTAAFLNDRTAGNTYTLSVDTDSGEVAESTFTILTTAQASSSPKTGDTSNLALWISALVLSGAAAAVIIPKMRKKNELM